jgi:CRP-like cAMP-binding protein
LQGSILAELFTEDEMRMILPDCKIVSKNAGEIIFQYDLADKMNHWMYVIEGDVMVTRTIDDEEVSQGKSVENSFFGAYKHLRKALQSYSLVREEEEEEVPILQGGNGVKNTIIKAATPVTLIRMRSTHLLRLLEVKGRQYQALVQHLQLEDPSRDINQPLYSLQATWKRGMAETIFCPENDEIVFFERSRDDSQIYGVVSELQRKKIKGTISAIEKIWAEITQGAPIIPLGTMRMIEEYLGEGGEQFFADLIKPLSRPGAPACLHPEHFWFCCIEFLSETMMSSTSEEFGVSNIDSNESDGKMTHFQAEVESVHGQQEYVTQKDAVKTDSDLYIFEEKESLKQKFESFMFKDRQIESRFVEVPPLLIETEFIRVAGELTGYLMGDAIRKYLTYTIVHHPYPISLANCREFCTLFGKPFDQSTKIMYPEIVKLLRDKKIQGQDQDGLFVESALNPSSSQIRVWIFLMRLVALYHIFMVPIRIAFMPYPRFTSFYALVSDGPMDVALGLHSLISLNTAFRDAKSSWITSRIRIFRETDFLCLFASIPCDWFGYLTGFSMEGCVWLRLNKMVLYYSRISPVQIIYSKGEVYTISDLLVVIFLVLHICASLYFFLGRAARHWQAEMGRPQISWFFIEDDFKDLSYERSEDFHFVFGKDAWVVERYVFSLYWVATSITVSGQVGKFLPQNVEEIIFTIGIMILNMTVYRWIIGEVSSIIMSADDSIVKAREDLERLTTFSSSKRFSDELREEIKSHFDAVQSGSSVDQDQLLSGLSHGLRVDLARFISREFLPKIDLFQGCSHQMLDSMCVLLIEVNFMPEEIVFRTGEIAKEMYFVLHGALEELDDDQDKVVRTARKNSALGTIPFSFGLRHFATARASRSGCVCMRLTRENLFEVLKTHPKDEETVMQNSLRTLNRESTGVTANDAKSTDGRSDRGAAGEAGADKKSTKSGVSSRSKLSNSDSKQSGNSGNSSQRSGGKKSHRSGASSGMRSVDRKSHHSRASRTSRASRASKANPSAVQESAVNGEGSQKGVNSESSESSGDDGSDVSAPLLCCRHVFRHLVCRT